ncbi:hypothetical protein OIE67_16065 [Nonomuraea fuscirosea]|uniref:hypothetical protein n=1 Tax=Nonomuraea fuscirosea TaxID=1291556 RepID=UPI002DD8E713|nr:hypothetical protein [Nonomuraea fuscirosea]WSA56058.1 hypothetical protein OIE67_16065 [Nonomuraea fuscirosea]
MTSLSRVVIPALFVMSVSLTYQSLGNRWLILWPAGLFIIGGLIFWARSLSPKGRVWLWLALAVLVTATLIALGIANGLGAIVSDWLQGKSPEKLLLGSTSMFWWGRYGKVMQFVAGLLVVLDLLGPDRLRKGGKRARGWTSVVNSWTEWLFLPVKHLDEEQWLRDHIMRRDRILGPAFSGHQTTMPGPAYRVDMVDEVPLGVSFSVEDYQALYGKVHDSPDADYETMLREVKTFVKTRLDPKAAGRWKRRRRFQSSMQWIFVLGCYGLLFLSVGAPDFGGDLWTLLLGTALMVGSLSYLIPQERWRRVPSELPILPLRLVTGLFVVVFDRKEPGISLRWLGLFIFCYGFALDLLAS